MVTPLTPTSFEWAIIERSRVSLDIIVSLLGDMVGVGVSESIVPDPSFLCKDLPSPTWILITNYSIPGWDWENLWGGSACAEVGVAGYYTSFYEKVWMKTPC